MFKHIIGEVRLKNYELRLLDNTIVYCDKETDMKTYTFDFGNTNYKTVNAFLQLDVSG